MKIERPNKIKTVFFDDIDTGDTFEYDEIVYLRLPNDYGYFNAIELTTEDFSYRLFETDEEVIPIQATLILER